jgi:hypothetical protein
MRRRIERCVFLRGTLRMTQHPDAGRVDDARRKARIHSLVGGRHQRVDRLPIDELTTLRIGCHVNQHIARFSSRGVRRGTRQLAEDRRGAAGRDVFRFFWIANECGDMVARTETGFEDR